MTHTEVPSAREWIGVAVLFLALTIAATWPQILEPSGIVPHRDSWFNMWRLAWVAHQIAHDPAHLFDANIHYPERHTLAYSDALLVPALIGAPWRAAGVPTPYVHTILVLGSFVLAGVGAWALVRTLTQSTSGGIAAGLVFAFSPYRFDHYMHLELLWSGWMPLALLTIHRTLARGRVRSGAAAGALIAAQTLSCIYYGVFFVTGILPLVAIEGTALQKPALRRAATALLSGALVAAAIVLPYFRPYLALRSELGDRGRGEASIYSAGPLHYLSATPDNRLYGRFADSTGRPEKRLFPGVGALALAGVAVCPPVARLPVAYAASLVLAVDLSFGPSGLTFDWLRDHVLPFRGLRAPARAGAVALLMIAVLAGIGWARLDRATAAWPRVRRRALTAVGLCAMAAEYAVTPMHLVDAPITPAPVYRWLVTQPVGVVAELPMPEEHGLPLYDAEFEYESTFHWRPIVNGYSGNVPASYINLLRAAHPFSRHTVERLRAAGVRYVIVHQHLFTPEEFLRTSAALDQQPGVVRHGPFGEGDERTVVYEFGRAAHD